MSGISVLQQLSPPTHAPGYLPTQPASQGSTSTLADEEIRKIKDAAKEIVIRETKSVSPVSVLAQAKRQLEHAHKLQSTGEYSSALRAFYISAELMHKSMDSADYKSGVIKKEVTDFVSKDGKDLVRKIGEVEKQYRTILTTGIKAPQANGINRQSGGSITDRLRSLEGAAGTTLKTTKPLAKDVPKPNGAPKRDTFKRDSPLRTTFPEELIATPTPRPPVNGLGLLLPSIPSSSSQTVPPTPASAAPSTPHSFVPTSSFGPPSPTSSPATSPRTTHHNLPSAPVQNGTDELAEFKNHFPTIEELDADLFPAKTGESSGSGRMHTGENGSPTKFNATYPPLSAMPTGSSVGSKRESFTLTRSPLPPVTNVDSHGYSPPSFRPFAMPIDRPSSTPIVPMTNGFGSRPTSPGAISPSPSWQPKSSALSAIPVVPEEVATNTEANLISPAEVAALIGKTTQMLLLDVRTRSAFLHEHIDAKANAMICIEPSSLMKSGASFSTIEDTLAASTMNDASLFRFRHNFERVVLYDQYSISFGPPSSPLSILAAIVSTPTPNSTMKHPPLLMFGGLDAWKREGRDLKVPTLPTISGTSTPRQLPPSPGMSPALSTSVNGVAPPTSPPAVHQETKPPSRPTAGPDSLPKPASSPLSHPPHQPIVYPSHTRSATESNPPFSPPLSNNVTSATPLIRRPAVSHAAVSSASANASSSRVESQSMQRPSPISYPQVSTRMSSASTSIPSSSITSPPAATSLVRRRSDYIDQSQEALSRHAPAHSVDYPNLPPYSSAMSVLRPPPPAASPTTERQDNRPRLPPKPTLNPLNLPSPPRIQSQVPIMYWGDQEIATSGMRNMGNTCYMSSTIQCLCATWPFARFFMDPGWTQAINMTNPLGSKGALAGAFASIVRELAQQDNTYIVPKKFRASICQQNQQYLGSDQHDSQEFLSFLLDGVHEDLNRIIGKPEVTKTREQEAELEVLPPQVAGEQEWQLWRLRNDSIIVDWFQGQFYNRLQCTTCGQTSTTYNAFSLLSLPIPGGRTKQVSLQRCFDAYCNRELLENDDAWDCTKCKVKRPASKELHLSRLPPVLIIHLKRFESNGRFSDKIDTFVDFPVKGLDLDQYMPPPLPAGAAKGALSSQMSLNDPRKQSPPYRYDLYGVTNHYGNLSSGHYTAFIASGRNWLYCDDSSIKKVDAKDVVNQKAYVLFYKRVKA